MASPTTAVVYIEVWQENEMGRTRLQLCGAPILFPGTDHRHGIVRRRRGTTQLRFLLPPQLRYRPHFHCLHAKLPRQRTSDYRNQQPVPQNRANPRNLQRHAFSCRDASCASLRLHQESDHRLLTLFSKKKKLSPEEDICSIFPLQGEAQWNTFVVCLTKTAIFPSYKKMAHSFHQISVFSLQN